MIRAVQIARFRGISDCVADGFARVNLIVGRNNCGKTTFMEAVRLVDDAENAIRYLLLGQGIRLRRTVSSRDFERFWQSLFFELDAHGGFVVSATRDDGAQKSLTVRQGAITEEIIVDPVEAGNGSDVVFLGDEEIGRGAAWALDVQLSTYEGGEVRQRVVATSTGVRLPPAAPTKGSSWLSPNADIRESNLRNISILKQRGQEATLLGLLREIDDRADGIELLARDGATAELFVRLKHGTLLLPVALMGDGFQRCFELGASATAHDWPTLFLDEIENGMHHLALEPLWRWIAMTARKRTLQVFATTHSEECIHAACRAFQALDDDGLRVIRLDRLESGTRATLYDRALVEIAERTGTEIRG